MLFLILELRLKTRLVLIVERLRVSFGRRLDLRDHLVLDHLRWTNSTLLRFSLEQYRVDLNIELSRTSVDDLSLQLLHARTRFRTQIRLRDLHSVHDAEYFRQRFVFAAAITRLSSDRRKDSKQHKKSD